MGFVNYETLMEEAIGVTLQEKVDFSFLPRFKQDPKLKDLYNVTKDAEVILKDEGIPNKAAGEKISSCLLRYCDIICNVESVATFPAIFSIFGIPVYLVARLMEWATKWGQEKVAISRAEKAIHKLELAKERATDKEHKEKLQDTIDKMNKKIESVNKYADD